MFDLVNKDLLKYIPKKLHKYITVLYKIDKGVYAIQLDIDDVEIPATVDGVKSLKWAAMWIYEHREFNF